MRENGLALFGPMPRTVIPVITWEEFVEAVLLYANEVSDWARREPDRKGQSYAILTLCRVMHVLRTGKAASKKQAALWAQQEFPEWSGLIRDALAWRQGWREDQIDHAATRSETRRFVDFANGQIQDWKTF